MKRLLFALMCLPIIVSAQKIYLIGDAGEPSYAEKNFQLMVEKTSEATADDILIFLGDNLYPQGLPDEEDPQRAEMEAKLVPQLDIMKDFPGQAYIIPGNHDWAQGRNYGWQNVQNMNEFISEYFEGENVFIPFNGCPGPVEIPVNDGFTLLLIDKCDVFNHFSSS